MAAELSVVILCYRAEDQAYDFVKKTSGLLKESGISWELILVGNYVKGSDDRTPKIIREIAANNEHIKAVTLPKEGMMGWDARSGLSVAEGRFICLIDGDEQMPYKDIIRVYKKIKDESLDFVQTYRTIRHDGISRKIKSVMYNLIFKILFPGAGVRDINSKPKIMMREVYRDMRLSSDDWFLDAEIIIQARRLKFKMGEIPTTFYKCKYRKSYVNFHAIFEFLKNLVAARIKEFFNL
jgi:glycosyltransferase involved in cell wall biosynthesis